MSRLRSIILAVFVCLFVLTTAMAWYSMQSAWLQLHTLEVKRAELARRHDRVEQQLGVRRAMLARLREDPAYVERTIRSRLGYVRDGEIVFRFPEE